MQTETKQPDTTYNGWTNYETWAAKLWMDNEQSSQEYWTERVREIKAHPTYHNEYMTPERRLVHEVKQALEDTHEEGMADLLDAGKLSASLYADLLNAALGRVNWYEIAEHLIEETD